MIPALLVLTAFTAPEPAPIPPSYTVCTGDSLSSLMRCAEEICTHSPPPFDRNNPRCLLINTLCDSLCELNAGTRLSASRKMSGKCNCEYW